MRDTILSLFKIIKWAVFGYSSYSLPTSYLGSENSSYVHKFSNHSLIKVWKKMLLFYLKKMYLMTYIMPLLYLKVNSAYPTGLPVQRRGRSWHKVLQEPGTWVTVICISLSLQSKAGRFNNGTWIGERNYKVSMQVNIQIILKQKKLQFPYDFVFHIHTERVIPFYILHQYLP